MTPTLGGFSSRGHFDSLSGYANRMTEILDGRGAGSHTNGPYQWGTAGGVEQMSRQCAGSPAAGLALVIDGRPRGEAGGRGRHGPANLVRLGASLQRIRRARNTPPCWRLAAPPDLPPPLANRRPGSRWDSLKNLRR